jgi:hypothetical protein
MGTIRQSKPKKANIEKLETFLKKIDNGNKKNITANTKREQDSSK